MTRRRGLTLIEILVAMAVLGLVMTGAMTLFLPSLGRFQKADTTYDAQRYALHATDMLRSDLREAKLGWIQIQGSPLDPGAASFRLAIPSPRDAAGNYQAGPDGTPIWTSWIVYWAAPDPDAPVGADGRPVACRLMRTQIRGDFSAPPTTYVPPANLAPGERLVASGVSALAVTRDAVPLASSRLGRVRVDLWTLRYYASQYTRFEGGCTIDVPF